MNKAWSEMTAAERLAQRLDIYVNMPGFQFASPEAEARYRERATIIRDAFEMKVPARVPVFPSEGFFPAFHAGLTMKDAMYEYEKVAAAILAYLEEFDPDAWFGALAIVPGRVFEILDYKLYDWPGQKLADHLIYQMIEDEYVTADEYAALSADPTDFFMRKYFPRVFGALEPLAKLPLMPSIQEMPMTPTAVLPFAFPDVQEAFKKLMQAGEEAMRWMQVMGGLGMQVRAMGVTDWAGGAAKAPFDAIGDTLRGTKGMLLDMFRNPDALRETCERFVPLMIEMAVSAVNQTQVPFVFMPLHKGADGFMSNAQFEKFYWPTLKKVMLGIAEEGCIPVMFAEGGYNQRLEIIADFPKGKCIWWFDQTDMKRAKEVLGDVCCIAGNVSTAIMAAGTPSEVKTYCKELIETAGQGGGFILTNGCGIDHARAENVHAMMEAGKEYGRY
ncbi:MAG: uroporphyrinogen decarboxylase [Anaerolineae bacterium]|nr:uroporphyrinogen decarboxylase [Anaerolineae bacterium]